VYSTDENLHLIAINKMNEDDDLTDAQMIKLLQKIHDYGIPWSRDIILQAERVSRSNVASWVRCAGCPE
jgi:hypothetical protein